MSIRTWARGVLEKTIASLPPHWQQFVRWSFGVRSVESLGPVPRGGITVVIPAYFEAKDIRRTVRSIQAQSIPAAEIIVIDDCSFDNTSALALSAGVRVVRQAKNRGKAAAQKLGLSLAQTEFLIFIDADTLPEPDAFEKMMPYFNEPKTAAVGGYVLPKYVGNFWEMARQFQYHYGGSIVKKGQNNTGSIFVSSGCFTAFRTSALRQVGIATDTLAEDLGTTFNLLARGFSVKFAEDAACYVVDPDTFPGYWHQGYRWNAGSFQTFKVWKFNFLPMGKWFAFSTYLNIFLNLAGPALELWSLYAIAEFFVSLAQGTMTEADALLPIRLMMAVGMLMLAVLFLVMKAAYKMRRDGRFWITLMAFVPFVLVHYIDVCIFYWAFIKEMLLKKTLTRWIKGHAASGGRTFSIHSAEKNSLGRLAHRACARGVINTAQAREIFVMGMRGYAAQ